MYVFHYGSQDFFPSWWFYEVSGPSRSNAACT